MGFFTKKEHTHVIRDEHGNVIKLERDNETEHLINEYREHHPTKLQQLKTNLNERRFEHQMQRANEKQAYNKAYHQARVERHTQLGRQAGSRTSGDRLERFVMGPPRRPQKIVHVYHNAPPKYNKQPKRKHHPQQKRRKNPFGNLDVFDNWGLLK